MGSIWSGLVRFFSPGEFGSQFGGLRADVSMNVVIVLIAAEILVAAVNIVVDLYAGVD